MRFYEVIIDIIIEGGSGFSEIAIMHFTLRIFLSRLTKSFSTGKILTFHLHFVHKGLLYIFPVIQ